VAACYTPAAHTQGVTIDEKPKPSEAKKVVRATFTYSHVGLFFGVAICIGLFGGLWLDNHFQTKPIFTLVGILVGVISGFRELYRVAKQYERQLKTRQKQEEKK
jgi:F0F1-type ATP synthase assembly protein I